MRCRASRAVLRQSALGCLLLACGAATLSSAQAPAAPAPAPVADAVDIGASDCAAERLGTTIPVDRIGEPVRRVTLSTPSWTAGTATAPAYCRVDGLIEPVDTSATARPINFGVVLPARWNRRAVQMGGGGMNGTIPGLTGGGAPGSPSLLSRGIVTYGSDSGHQAGFGLPGVRGGGRPGGGPAPGGPPTTAPTGGRDTAAQTGGGRTGGLPGAGRGAAPADDWALNDEAMTNLGYMQMKKTHDAAMVLIERAYGARPRFNYYIGTSQGGREALTVAQRYPADYDGISRDVPIVNFSTLMLAPELIRIHEKPLANWVTPAKVNAIRGEFMRQCDTLDGLADGVINNYMACRAIFDVSQGTQGPAAVGGQALPGQRRSESGRHHRRRVPDRRPDLDAGVHVLALPLRDAAGQRHEDVRHVGAEHRSVRQRPDRQRALPRPGRRRDTAARCTRTSGVLGVTGFLMQDLAANPLDYVEGGALNARRDRDLPRARLDQSRPVAPSRSAAAR